MKVRNGFYDLAAVFTLIAFAWFFLTSMAALIEIPNESIGHIRDYIPWYSWVSGGVTIFLYSVGRSQE